MRRACAARPAGGGADNAVSTAFTALLTCESGPLGTDGTLKVYEGNPRQGALLLVVVRRHSACGAGGSIA